MPLGGRKTFDFYAIIPMPTNDKMKYNNSHRNTKQ